jgi:ClpX C4-type zinc finger
VVSGCITRREGRRHGLEPIAIGFTVGRRVLALPRPDRPRRVDRAKHRWCGLAGAGRCGNKEAENDDDPGDQQSTAVTDGQPARCSFCKQGSEAVGELIAGPAGPGCAPAYICAAPRRVWLHHRARYRGVRRADRLPGQIPGRAQTAVATPPVKSPHLWPRACGNQ